MCRPNTPALQLRQRNDKHFDTSHASNIPGLGQNPDSVEAKCIHGYTSSMDVDQWQVASAQPVASCCSATTTPTYSICQLVAHAVKLGTMKFGGPVALVGYMHPDLSRRPSMDRRSRVQGLALAQLIARPLAAQLTMYLGYVHYGVLGATWVGLAFVLPSFLVVFGLDWIYLSYGGLPWMEAVFYGVGASVIGIITVSTWKLTRQSLGQERLLWLIFLVSVAVRIVTEMETLAPDCQRKVAPTKPLGAAVEGKLDRVDRVKFKTGLNGDVLIVPVRIGTEVLSFMLDTGAASSAIDKGDAARVGVRTPSRRRYSPGFPQMFELPRFQLDDTAIVGACDVAVFDLSLMRTASGHDIRGILGVDFLKDYVIEVDFDEGALSLSKSPPASSDSRFQLGRDRLNRLTLALPITSNRTVPFLIDTGMVVPGVGEISQNVFDDLLLNGKLSVVGEAGQAVSVSGTVTGRKGQLASFTVGRFEHRQLGARAGSLNAIGLDYLSRYRVTIDYPRSVLYLRPGRRFAARTAFDMSGLVLLRADGQTIVDKVHFGSPAAALGLLKGDHIEEIDEIRSGDRSLLEIRRMLASEVGRLVSLSYSRAGVSRQCIVQLANWQNADLTGQLALENAP